MAMHPYERAELLRGVTFHSQKLADQVGLKQLLECETGLSFASYLSDRKAAYRLKMAVKEWLLSNCQTYLDDVPYEEADLTRDQVLNKATYDVYWSMVCQEYGKDRAIEVRNNIYSDFSIREEFLAEGDAASSRDFSYLLDKIDKKN